MGGGRRGLGRSHRPFPCPRSPGGPRAAPPGFPARQRPRRFRRYGPTGRVCRSLPLASGAELPPRALPLPAVSLRVVLLPSCLFRPVLAPPTRPPCAGDCSKAALVSAGGRRGAVEPWPRFRAAMPQAPGRARLSLLPEGLRQNPTNPEPLSAPPPRPAARPRFRSWGAPGGTFPGQRCLCSLRL